ncbi:MAG: DUF2304 domain-containing protein [Bacteroidota bacterium]
MENVLSIKIQIIAIAISLVFLGYVGWLIVKGKLREEYSFVWVVITVILILFSIWRDGLEVVAKFLGVFAASNLIFMAAIFVILIYLLHLSVVISKLQSNNKELAQQLALLKKLLERMENKNENASSKKEDLK